jgi:hypothetical protein
MMASNLETGPKAVRTLIVNVETRVCFRDGIERALKYYSEERIGTDKA